MNSVKDKSYVGVWVNFADPKHKIERYSSVFFFMTKNLTMIMMMGIMLWNIWWPWMHTFGQVHWTGHDCNWSKCHKKCMNALNDRHASHLEASSEYFAPVFKLSDFIKLNLASWVHIKVHCISLQEKIGTVFLPFKNCTKHSEAINSNYIQIWWK